MTNFASGTLILLGSLLCCGSILAADMNFHGVLTEPPPCTISNGQVIEVPFGDNIGVNTVDGAAHRQKVDYHITCDLNSSTDGLALSLSTTSPASFDASAVQTSLSGLGIRMMWDGKPAEFGQAVPVDPLDTPVLEAVPVKAPGVELAEGRFEAYVTLQAVYQ
ncbi:fimbrial protein [Enterobacter cancerogenus]|uniref:Fimbrial protein n=1 Tax=Enterobacter cancerogenus TaxID=69218 RepID=A0A484WW34_9ENTR|nr:fimbrial protein [Enterobacter cancerogenus]HDX4396465.1 fimbrial protein [Enterobacter bugandensis]